MYEPRILMNLSLIIMLRVVDFLYRTWLRADERDLSMILGKKIDSKFYDRLVCIVH